MIMPRISILMYVVMALFQCPRTAARVAAGGQLQSGGGFRIAGRVVNAKAGTPLERARVSITDTKNPQRSLSVLTSDDGQFQFNGLPAGKFALEGAKRGFIRAAYDHHDQFSTAIVTGAGLDTESLILRLDPVAVLSGKILDEAGDPVRHASVTLYREDRFSGVSRIHRIRETQTDDQGSYELTPLDAGTYFVAAKRSLGTKCILPRHERRAPKIRLYWCIQRSMWHMQQLSTEILQSLRRPLPFRFAAAIASKLTYT